MFHFIVDIIFLEKFKHPPCGFKGDFIEKFEYSPLNYVASRSLRKKVSSEAQMNLSMKVLPIHCIIKNCDKSSQTCIFHGSGSFLSKDVF